MSSWGKYAYTMGGVKPRGQGLWPKIMMTWYKSNEKVSFLFLLYVQKMYMGRKLFFGQMWIGKNPLSTRFPTLYGLGKNKSCMLKNRWLDNH